GHRVQRPRGQGEHDEEDVPETGSAGKQLAGPSAAARGPDGPVHRLPGTLGVSVWVRRPILPPSQTSGSYLRPTTRSFSGISALSVILMCSGQTSVQHLVMLQKPRPKSSWAISRRSAVSAGCISSSAIRPQLIRIVT